MKDYDITDELIIREDTSGYSFEKSKGEQTMLSKEEYTPIELREHCIKTMQFLNRNSNAYKEHELILSIMDENISMKYKLDQLESDKQKLIEKLEKDIKNDLTINEHIVSNGVVLGTRTTHIKTYATEILSILKGENDEV